MPIKSLLILALFFGCNAPGDKAVAISKVVLTDLEGRSIDLGQFKGKTVFINFWATWCKPCIQEMPLIKKVQDSLSKNGIIFLLASEEDSDNIREFENSYNFNFNYARVLNLQELDIYGLPATHIFNPQGARKFAETGYRKWDDSVNIAMILKINSEK